MKRFKNFKNHRDGSLSSFKGLFLKALIQYIYHDWRKAKTTVHEAEISDALNPLVQIIINKD